MGSGCVTDAVKTRDLGFGFLGLRFYPVIRA